MKTKTYAWDAAEHLKTKEDMAAYVACALCGEKTAPRWVASACLGFVKYVTQRLGGAEVAQSF